MRWVSTEVLPVPAPATTSMGPRTCSIASRWCTSAVNGVGRKFDLWDRIAAQDITCEREEPCAKNGVLGRDNRSGCPYTIRATSLRLDLPGRCRRYCLRDPRSTPASRCWGRRTWEARRCHRHRELVLQWPRNLPPLASRRTRSYQIAVEEFWRGASAGLRANRRSRSSSKQSQVRGPLRTSSQKLESKN